MSTYDSDMCACHLLTDFKALTRRKQSRVVPQSAHSMGADEDMRAWLHLGLEHGWLKTDWPHALAEQPEGPCATAAVFASALPNCLLAAWSVHMLQLQA